MRRFILVLIVLLGATSAIYAQTESPRVTGLENRVSSLEQRIRSDGDAGIALFVCAAFCALWAQNSGRNAWLWFFLGLFFSLITLLVMLWKNAADRDGNDRRRRFNLQDFRKS